MKKLLSSFGLFASVFMVILPGSAELASAQLTGYAGFGIQTTNNVQELDTIAPDQLLMPAFELDYDWRVSGVSTVSLTGAYTPSFYQVNPGLSFNQTTIGATGVFYLSHQDAIASESNSNEIDDELGPRHGPHFMMSEYNASDPVLNSFLSGFPQPIVTPPGNFVRTTDPSAANDSLVDLAESALYTLSGELDSTDISPQGISKARVSEFENLRDSISDIVSTVADLLDSSGYSGSALEIVIPELENLRTPLARLIPQTKPSKTDPKLLESAISLLKNAKPQPDFIPTSPMPMSQMPIGPSQPAQAGTNPSPAKPHTALVSSIIPQIVTPTPTAPAITLITSSTRLRQFGYSDVYVREDADDSDATTLATALTVPVSYSTHEGVSYSPADTVLFGGNYGGNPNNSKTMSFGAGIEGYTSTNFSLRGSYDYTRTEYDFDSVYSSTENRFSLLPRIAATKSFVLFPEASIGFRKYLDPIHIYDTTTKDTIITGPKGRKKDTTLTSIKAYTAGSNFTQYSFGLGGAGFIGDRWVIGAVTAFNRNPNLRAYISTAEFDSVKAKTVRPAVQIADDEYTYNLARYGVFTDARIFYDIDVGADFSYEHRLYGNAVGPKGNLLPGGEGRTEDCRFLNVSVSKLLPFESNLIGVFNSLWLECLFAYSNVSSSDPLQFYTYKSTNVTLTANLYF